MTFKDYKLPFVHRPSEAGVRDPVAASGRPHGRACWPPSNRGVELTKSDDPGGDIQALREHLSKLSEASLRICESLDVNTVLREVVESARALTSAGCSGITTMDASGHLQDFVTAGVSPEEYQRFLNLPHGPGLWEYLRAIPQPLRLWDLAAHLGPLGFPDDPTLARSFLGTPIRHRGVQLGNFHLADKGGLALVLRPAGQPRGEDGEGEEAHDSASDARSCESLYVPLIRSGVVAVHKGRFFHEAPAVGAGHVDHHGDSVHHAPTRHVPREIAAALHRAARQSGEGTLGVVGVDGGERAAVAGVEGLQQVGGFAAAHFADHDVIGSVAEGVLHQIADRDRAVLQPARLEADAVRGVDAEFQGVLDGDDPLVVGEQLDERVEERRLAAAGAAAHQDVALGVQRLFRRRADVLGERAVCDQLRRREGSCAEPPHGDRHVRAGRRDADRHARAVAEARIEDRRGGRVQAQGPGDMNRRPFQRRRVERGRGNRPEPAVAFEPHVARPVDHDFAHVRIVERGLKARQKRFQEVQAVAAHL